MRAPRFVVINMATSALGPFRRAGSFLIVFFLALASANEAAQAQEARFVAKLPIPGAQEVAVVAEGEFEPRSIGSYTVRVYSGVPARFPTDRFLAGMVRPRDGAIESVSFADLDGDGRVEIIVSIRSVGTGGYLSADAFSFSGTSLRLVAGVAGLDKRADPVGALSEEIRQPR